MAFFFIRTKFNLALAQGLLGTTQMSAELQQLVTARGDEIVAKWAHQSGYFVLRAKAWGVPL
jgi:hypothetical protein